MSSLPTGVSYYTIVADGSVVMSTVNTCKDISTSPATESIFLDRISRSNNAMVSHDDTLINVPLSETNRIGIEVQSFKVHNDDGSNLYTYGKSSTDIKFDWSLNRVPTSVKLRNTVTNKYVSVTPPPRHARNFVCPTELLPKSEADDASYQLIVQTEIGSPTQVSTDTSSTVTTRSQNWVYYGCGDANVEIKDNMSLNGYAICRSKNNLSSHRFSVTCNENKYIYFLIPSRFCPVTLSNSSAITGGFVCLSHNTITKTHSGASSGEKYDLYRSINHSLGNQTIIITGGST
jgi:hypothetical protein